jgi:hypothetical protein
MCWPESHPCSPQNKRNVCISCGAAASPLLPSRATANIPTVRSLHNKILPVELLPPHFLSRLFFYTSGPGGIWNEPRNVAETPTKQKRMCAWKKQITDYPSIWHSDTVVQTLNQYSNSFLSLNLFLCNYLIQNTTLILVVTHRTSFTRRAVTQNLLKYTQRRIINV